jgi:glycosyltransferase involved in cell wall biosynthesis
VVPSRRLHILIDYRPALRQRTGVGEYVHRLTDAMLRQLTPGERLTVFSSSWKDRLRQVPDGASRLDLRIPVKTLNFAWHRLGWPPVERFGVAPDITWSLHPLLMPSRHAVRAVTIHDLYFLDRPEHTAAEIRRDYAALAPRHAARADLVVVNSAYTRGEVIRRLGVEADRVTVCYPGAPALPPRPLPPSAGPILHIGTIEPRKNVEALIRAYAELGRSRPHVPPLVFAGRSADRVGLPADLSAGRIEFLGYVEDERKAQLYREASMLVIPSNDEGFGIPALEAMTVGVPVVAAGRGALPEVVADAGILCDADAAADLAGAMGRILDSEPLRLDLRARGIERARAFTWQASAARLLAAFRSAHDRRKASA